METLVHYAPEYSPKCSISVQFGGFLMGLIGLYNQQFEIEAISGEKVDHSENYGMVKWRKRSKMAPGVNRKP
jgi:hypothetical protein